MRNFISILGVLSILGLVGAITDNGPRVVCYYGSWANYRPGEGKFTIEDTDVSLCTHFVYTFAGLSSSHEIISLDPWMDMPDGLDGFNRVVALGNLPSTTKILLAIGGWNEGSAKYSAMARTASTRRTFIDSVVAMLSEYNFHGLDLDWEYPAKRGGVPEDKHNLVLLLQELRAELDKHGWLLSIAVGMKIDTIEIAYDVPAVAAAVHMVNMMAYDFRGSWDGKTGHHTQMYTRPEDDGNFVYYNTNSSVHIWIEGGAPKSKLNLGMGFYGKNFQVVAAQNNGPLDEPAQGPGAAGPYTRQAGMQGYNEFCILLNSEVWTVVREPLVVGPYAYRGDQWIGYDDVESMLQKSNWAKNLGLGGGMLWSIETDDFHGKCGGGKYPLLKAMNDVWMDGVIPPPPQNTTTTTADPNAPTTTTTTTQKPTTPDSLIDNCFTAGINYPMTDPNDCSGFYECAPSDDGGVWIHKSCPGGLYYNSEILACDYHPGPDCVVSRRQLRGSTH